MSTNRIHAPTPDLRIVPGEALHAHEEHDSQRAHPLIKRLKHEAYIINPPIVAPIDEGKFVILDGANRCHAFITLGYPHMLVQVTSYESGYVDLETWNHVIGDWDAQLFLNSVADLHGIEVISGQDVHAIAHVLLPNHQVFALCSPVDSVHERNAALRQVVAIYQQHARLYRTPLSEPEEVWSLYEDGVALVVFPRYKPVDIIAAAKYDAYLPPGVSRHIVHGRALRVNYPIENLRDEHSTLAEKNQRLKHWLQEKLVNRQIRYYAETTYQFDE
jgi:hypothetical protein